MSLASASKMLVLVLTVAALAISARADCDACVAGRCHSRRPIASGFPVTDQLAIDRTNNVLYLQYNNYINTAIFLDDLQTRLVNMMRSSGMAVDQKTGVLYMGTKEVDDTFYKYYLINNNTEAINNVEDFGKKPSLLFYGANDLHFVSNNFPSVRLYDMIERSGYYYANIKTYYISDFIITEDKQLFFVSKDTTYTFDLNKNDTAHVISNNNNKLSLDKYDNVYLTDKTDKVIYKRDKTTGKLEKYASYTNGLIKDFVFDKDNRIVYRDEGGVAQWVPAPAHRRCVLDPQGGFLMKVV